MFKYFKETTKDKIKKEIIINGESLETRVAVLVDGYLEDFFIEHPTEDRIVGSIFKGKVQNLEDGLQAAFVDIGMNKNAFIHYWDMFPEDSDRLEAEEGESSRRLPRKKKFAPGSMAEKFPIGSEVVVQVTKGAIGTKGPRVTASLSIPGRYLVMMPGSRLKGVSRKIEDNKERERLKKILARLPIPKDLGLIVRTAGLGTRKVSFVRDARGLITAWNQVEERIKSQPAPCRLYQEPDLVERTVRDSLTEDIDRIVVDDRDMFDRVKVIMSNMARRARNKAMLYEGQAHIFDHFDVERQLEQAYRRKVWLKSGGYIVLDETEALVAIDVNTGRHKGGKSHEESILQVNCEAAMEVSRQLRLRNIGGLLVIDFIDMKQRRHQNMVYKTLTENLKKDRARNNVLPISSLGLLEMTRQRVEESIRSSVYNDCPYCRGRAKIKSELSMSIEIQRRIAEIMRKHEGDKKESVSLKVIVHPAILDRLRNEDEENLLGLEDKYKVRLSFVSDSHLHRETFSISDADSGDSLYSAEDRGSEG